ncbi:MAG TPA: hypothetical protein VFU93_13940 [Acidimicrobiales bacterium]|nr:hypothetical protein [Acidimicrobiales bacterium]
MEIAIAIAVTVGPLALILLLLVKSVRPRLRPRSEPLSPPAEWFRGPMGGRGGKAGDRSPTRPRVPTLSGGAALDLPIEDDLLEDPVGPTRIAG